MKKIFSIMMMLTLGIAAWGSETVTVRLAEGIEEGALKTKIEQTMSAILTEALSAHEGKRNMSYTSLRLDEDAQSSLSMLWENSPFIPMDYEIVEKCLTTGTGYQVRNISLILTDAPEDDNYKQGVFNFDKRGNLRSFNLAIDNNLYMNVIKENKELIDLERRHLILDYVEQFRTAYNQKDRKFLRAIFSDDALIITGKVEPGKMKDGIKVPDKITLEPMGKEKYLQRLFKVFALNKYIRVTFDEIKVMAHPNEKYKDFYGVTLHQGYSSDRYHDDGYLFLLWDFRNPSRPLIHVRTWQPDAYDKDGSGMKTRIDEDEILGIEDFTNLDIID